MNAPDRSLLVGEFRDMPSEDYHAIEALSASGMRLLARSAWHYKHRLPMTQTRAMLRGTLVHCAQLEPDVLAARYAVVPADAPRKPTAAQWAAKKSNEDSMAAKEWWNDFAARTAGKTIITADEMSLVEAQLYAINSNPDLAAMFATGYAETSVFWIDQSTGAYCKARPDWVHEVDEDTVDLVDLKATADESPRGFGRTLANMGYHRQAAHYIKGFETATGKRVRNFVFAAVTSAPPVLAVPYELDSISHGQGMTECVELAALYVQCQKTRTWPAYGPGIQLLSLPGWAIDQQEMEPSHA